MTIHSILQQPNSANDANFLVAAYRQVFFEVLADSIVPADQPMYADVYFGPAFQITYDSASYVYYKTFSAYSISDDGSGHSIFLFDVQDALQEYLQTFIPPVPRPATSFPMLTDSSTSFSNINAQVYFRGSTIVAGLLVPNPTIPTQATATTPAVSPYSGAPSNVMVGCNASILPNLATQYDNEYEQELLTKLIPSGTYLPGTRAYSLSNRPINAPLSPAGNSIVNNYVGYNGYFPIVICEFGVSGSLSRFTRLIDITIIILDDSGAIIGTSGPLPAPVTITTGTYYLPVGLADMALMLGITDPAFYATLIQVSGNYNYCFTLDDNTAGSGDLILITPTFKVNNVNPASVGQFTCLWFQNLHGHFEQVTFVRSEEDYNTKSSQLFRPYTQVNATPDTGLQLGIKRYNVRSNDEISISAIFNEELMPWLKELISSPYVLMQVLNNSTQSFRAVVVIDGTFKTKKILTEQGVKYETTLKIRPAIDTIQLRN